MGQDVAPAVFSEEDAVAFRTQVAAGTQALGRMLDEGAFTSGRSLTGMEVEFHLVDPSGAPAPRNAAVLAAIDDPDFTPELAQFNIELNVPPRLLDGHQAVGLEAELAAQLDRAQTRARDLDSGLVMIGILPTLRAGDLTARALSANARYTLLDQQALAARGTPLEIVIDGPQPLRLEVDTLTPEAACTSVQFHLQVDPDRFASRWNAAQAIAAAQVALGANSPFFAGHRLWEETRIALFTQATETRPAHLRARHSGMRPRVWFGERWARGPLQLFEENLHFFPPLLPVHDDEDPLAVLDAGGVPALSPLRLHNGTVWRWNRPVYAVGEDGPHLRVENRVLPAGPTLVDILANGAFFYGAVHALGTAPDPVWDRLSFHAAEANFLAASRLGLQARVTWPGMGAVSVQTLLLRRLIPLAHEGLRDWGVADEVRERLLGVVEARTATGRTGSAWQRSTVESLEAGGLTADEAMVEMTRRYIAQMHAGDPVHTWQVP